MKKVKMIFLSALGLLVIATVIYLIADRPHTPQFRNADGQVLKGGIASLEMVNIGGVNQHILIRGKNISSSVIPSRRTRNASHVPCSRFSKAA